MQRSGPGLRDAAARLADLARRNPEWGTWVALLRRARPALEDASWDDAVAVGTRDAGAGADRPLLDARDLLVDLDRVRRLVATLRREVVTSPVSPPEGSDPAAALETVLRHAADATTLPASLEPILRLAALPVLMAARRRLAPEVPRHWPHGFCPVCGAWALLVELRGIERARHLRCGHCAADWETTWLRCVFCGEADHRQLGALVPEAALETERAETCTSCGRYSKVVTTLQPLETMELLIRDLETLELDLVAAARGWCRPPEAGVPVAVRVRPRSG